MVISVWKIIFHGGFRIDSFLPDRGDHPQEAQFRLLQPLQLFELETGFAAPSGSDADPLWANVLKRFESL